MAKKNTVLFFCKRHKKARDAGQKLRAWLSEHGFVPLDVTESEGKLEPSTLRDVALGVVIGGDGTFLTLLRRLDDKALFPLLGINLGSLGFITEVSPDDMISVVSSALSGKCREESRRLIQVEICRKDVCRLSGLVFNDAVITKDARSPMLKFDVYVGDEFLSYVRADGYIVATPTGSTAYSLSAGGPILHPAVNGVILVPLCPHSLSARPVVVPDSLEIRIVPREFRGTVFLVLDGQINHEIEEKDTIRIRQSSSYLKLIRSPEHQWSKTLQSKLDMA